jgi:Uma2 family endonuclease
MAEARAVRWTVADVEALPYDEWHRYEIIDGELFVSTAPHYEHQGACAQSTGALVQWNEQTQLGRVFVAPGLIFTETDAVIPDVVWISRERLAQIGDDAGHLRGAAELVVEVLSPGAANERRDRERKLALYSAHGVGEYWLVDWRARTVEVHRREQNELRLVATLGREESLTSPLLPGFALPLARLFSLES